MVTMQRGFKSKLDTGGIDAGQPLQVWISIKGNSQYDFSCLAVNENDRVDDDRYVVFYGRKSSPNGEISLISDSSKNAEFHVNLASLSPQIYKLCFAVTIDGNSTMRDINACTVKLMQNGQTAFDLEVTGSLFQSQKAIITVEIYNKNGWRVSAVANGFNFSGGLEALMTHYGVEVSYDAETSSPPPPNKPSEPPVRSAAQDSPPRAEQSPPPPRIEIDNSPASGKNAEGFVRGDDDWV
jgi:tellurite resistance protein TerA